MNRRSFIVGGSAAVAVATVGASAAGAKLGQRTNARNAAAAPSAVRVSDESPNVLFISLDDVNDWVGFLGNHPGTSTPHLDALARESLSFSSAYCTAAFCIPARTGVMFGKRPWEVGVYDHSEESRANAKKMEATTKCLIDDMRYAGYDTYGAGKLYHGPLKKRWTDYISTNFYVSGGGVEQSSAHLDPQWLSPYDQQPIGDGRRFQKWMIDFGPSGKAPADDPDGVSAEWIRKQLTKNHKRPFFLGLGLTATHVPWRIPQQFFDLHPLDQIVLPEVRTDDLDDVGPLAKATADQNGFKRLQNAGVWPSMVQAYQAAQSYADDRVGAVLDTLRNSKYADNTIVVVWSDHGFHLGEKMHIHKFTLWERATHVPFLLHVPKRFDKGSVFERPVSTLDVAPTLAELCGYEIVRPQSGKSLLPLVDHPERADERPPIMTREAGNHSVRRGPWRYTRYHTGEAELYDHRTDPDEFTNIVNQPELKPTIDELARFLPTEDVERASAGATSIPGAGD